MLKNSFWTSLASLAFALFSLASNKLFSFFYGPQGVTLLAHFQNIVAIFTTLPNDGINRGMVKFLSGQGIEQSRWNQYFSASLLLNAASFVGGIVLVCSFSGVYIKDFPAGLFSVDNIAFMLLGVLAHFVNLFAVTYLMAIGRVPAFSIFSILNNVAGAAAVYWGLQNGLPNALVMLALYPLPATLAMLVYVGRMERHRFKAFSFLLHRPAMKDISQFILIALSSVVFGRLTDFFVREFVIGRFDLYQTGLWQGIVKISDGYSAVFNAAFGLLVFAKMSALHSEGDKEALRKFLYRALGLVTLVSVAGLAFVYIFKQQLLVLLYNKEFLQATYLFDYQILGDLAKFPTMVLGYLLLAEMRVKAYVFLQAFSTFMYCGSLFFFIVPMGLEGLPAAHCLRYIAYLLALVYFSRKILFSKH